MLFFDIIMLDERFAQMIGSEIEFPAIFICDDLVTNIFFVDFVLERRKERV